MVLAETLSYKSDSGHWRASVIPAMCFYEMLKVTLTDKNWNEHVGYWNWIKVFYFLNRPNQTKPNQIGTGQISSSFKQTKPVVFQLILKSHLSVFLWPGWSRERLQAHLRRLPQSLLHPGRLPQSRPLRWTPSSKPEFLSQVGRKNFQIESF